MTDRAQFEAMLEALINDDQEQAKEIFHNIVVGKSREIYEELLESDFNPDKDMPYGKGEDDSDSEDNSDDTEDDSDDTEDDAEDEIEKDIDDAEDDAEDIESDDMEAEKDTEESDLDSAEHEEGEIEDRVMDLEDALEDLKAEFEQLMAGEEGEEHDMGGDMMGGDMDHGDQEMDMMMEYVIPVKDGHGAEKKSTPTGKAAGTGAHSDVHGEHNTKSIIDNMPNPMGGTFKNLNQGHVEVHGDAGTKNGKGTTGGLVKNTPQDIKSGNINVPGGKAGKTAFKSQVKGGGIDRQSGFTKPGASVGTGSHSDVRGDANTRVVVGQNNTGRNGGKRA